VTGLYTVRVAAGLRRELKTDVEVGQCGYGEFKVLVDGAPLLMGGTAAFLGVLPSGKKIIAAVRDSLKLRRRCISRDLSEALLSTPLFRKRKIFDHVCLPKLSVSSVLLLSCKASVIPVTAQNAPSDKLN
jgi:hypothetical protein